MNRPTLTHLVRPAILTVLLTTVLLLGAGPSAWATPEQAPAGQTVPTATPGAPEIPQITPPAGNIAGATTQSVAPGIPTTATSAGATVELPANALPEPGTLVVRPMAPNTLPAASTGFALLGKSVEIAFYDAQGNPIAHPTFANPIQICFNYSADDLAKAGGHADDLLVQFYDISIQRWVALPTASDATGGRACATANQLGLAALAARSSTPEVLPQTGLTSSKQTTQLSNARFWWIIVVLLAALGASIALACRARRLRRGSHSA